MAPVFAPPVMPVQNRHKKSVDEFVPENRLLTPDQLEDIAYRARQSGSLSHNELLDLAYSSLVYQKSYLIVLERMANTYGGKAAIQFGARIIAEVQEKLGHQ